MDVYEFVYVYMYEYTCIVGMRMFMYVFSDAPQFPQTFLTGL